MHCLCIINITDNWIDVVNEKKETDKNGERGGSGRCVCIEVRGWVGIGTQAEKRVGLRRGLLTVGVVATGFGGDSDGSGGGKKGARRRSNWIEAIYGHYYY